MKVTYNENNQMETSNILESGERKLEIAFQAKGLLRDLPSVFLIPDHLLKEHVGNSPTQFFLNDDFDKEPVEWVIDGGERPSWYLSESPVARLNYASSKLHCTPCGKCEASNM
jgi:hypothetical protein